MLGIKIGGPDGPPGGLTERALTRLERLGGLLEAVVPEPIEQIHVVKKSRCDYPFHFFDR